MTTDVNTLLGGDTAAPQFAAPEGTQEAVDSVVSAAAKAAPEKPKFEPACSSCGKGNLVRKDKQGKPKIDGKTGNLLYDKAVFLVIKPDGEPARHESGERKRYHFACAHAVRNLAPLEYRNDVEVLPGFKFDERKRERQNEWRERNRGAQAEGAEIWSGVKKTLGAGGNREASFADPKGPQHTSGMAAAFAQANDDRPVDPESFGKPEEKGRRAKRGGARDGKTHRRGKDYE